MRLIRPAAVHEAAYLDFARDWAETGEEITPYSARLLGDSYTTWLSKTYAIETAAPEGFVTAHTFFLMDEGAILGAINIRHALNDYLLNFGGHIGYGIRPGARRRGLAKAQLALALPIVKSLGIDRALITCDKDNIGSALTIEANGGVLENEVPEDGKITKRYWIEL